MKSFQISSSILLSLFLGTIILPELFIIPQPISKVGAHPIVINESSTVNELYNNHQLLNEDNNKIYDDYLNITSKQTHIDGHIECKMCSYVVTKLNTTLFNNPKVIAFVTADIEKICNILPESVKPECNNAAINIAPIVLQQVGVFIADEGCQELGICPGL